MSAVLGISNPNEIWRSINIGVGGGVWPILIDMFEEREEKVVGYYYTYLNHNLLKLDHPNITSLSVKRLYPRV